VTTRELYSAGSLCPRTIYIFFSCVSSDLCAKVRKYILICLCLCSGEKIKFAHEARRVPKIPKLALARPSSRAQPVKQVLVVSRLAVRFFFGLRLFFLVHFAVAIYVFGFE
jgi:hypothetical protein